MATLNKANNKITLSGLHAYLPYINIALCSQHVALAIILVSLSVPSSKNLMKSMSVPCVGVINAIGFTISRETHCSVHIKVGFKVGMASIKAYTSQYVVLLMIALQLLILDHALCLPSTVLHQIQ